MRNIQLSTASTQNIHAHYKHNSQVVPKQIPQSWQSPSSVACWSVYQELVYCCVNPRHSAVHLHTDVHPATLLSRYSGICSPTGGISHDPIKPQPPLVSSSCQNCDCIKLPVHYVIVQLASFLPDVCLSACPHFYVHSHHWNAQIWLFSIKWMSAHCLM